MTVGPLTATRPELGFAPCRPVEQLTRRTHDAESRRRAAGRDIVPFTPISRVREGLLSLIAGPAASAPRPARAAAPVAPPTYSLPPPARAAELSTRAASRAARLSR